MLKDGILFSGINPVHVLLLVIVLVRIFLNTSNLAAFVTVSLTSFLSFTFFESVLALSPILLFFLKDYLLALLTSIKTKVKKCFFSGNQEQEKDTVLWMKEKEKAFPISEEKTTPISTEGGNSKDPSFVRIQDGRVQAEFPAPVDHLKWVNYNHKQDSSYPQQDRVSTTIKAEPVRPLRYTVGDLQARDNPNLSVRKSVEQTEIDLSPLHCYEHFSTTVTVKSVREAFQDQAEKGYARVKEKYSKVVSPENSQKLLKSPAQIGQEKGEPSTSNNPNQAKPCASGQETTESSYLTLSERHGSPGNSPYSVHAHLNLFSNQEGTDPCKGRSSQRQVVSREQPLSKPDPYESPGNSPTFRPPSSHTPGSPLEEIFEKARFVVLSCSALGAITLFTTIKIVWVVLKKLDYSQEWVKRMTDKGWPKFLFFFVRHPNPGPVGGKPLFVLLITVLVGNIIVLYILLKMIYFVF